MEVSVEIVLDDILKQRGISRYMLAKKTGIAYTTIDSYYKNTVLRYDKNTILKICQALECEPGDIIKLVKTECSSSSSGTC